jgi:sortase B
MADDTTKVPTEETPEEVIAEEAASEGAVAEEVVTKEAVAEETVTEETVAEEAVAEEAVTEEIVTEETVAVEVVTEETVTEEAVTEETLAEETVTEETAPEEDLPKKYSPFPAKGDSIGEIIRKLVFIISLTAFIVAGVIFISTLMQSKRAVADKEVNQSIANTTVATTVNEDGEIVTVPPTIEEQKKHNLTLNDHYLAITDNYVGYLWADGCEISDPVVQADDNEYYLKQTYYDEPNKAGAIFMDFRVIMNENYISPNVVIYGHNQEDGTMFGNLKRYKNNVEFYTENPFIQFNTLYDIGDYVVFGFFVTNALESQDSEGEVFRYHDYMESLKNEATFYWYLNEVYKRNQIVSPIDVTYGDKLLTLSTCSNEFTESRFVVFARKLRPGEKREDFNFADTVYNVNAEGIDWDAIIGTTPVTEPAPETVFSDADEIGMLITRAAGPVTESVTEPVTESVTTVPPQ